MSRSRLRRFLVIAATVLAATILIVAITAWFLRDLPRRKIESLLAERLRADVELGTLVIQGTQDFILHDLVVTRVTGWKRLRRITIGTLVVAGRPSEIIERRFDLLDASSVEVVFGTPDATIPELIEPVMEPVVERFRLTDARLVLEDMEATATASVEADLTGIGGDLAGVVRASSDRVDFTGGGFTGVVRTLQGAAEFAKGGSGISTRASADNIEMQRNGQSVTIPKAEIASELTPRDNEKLLGFVARATVSGIEEVAMKGTLDEESVRLIDADGAIRGIDVATWLPLVPGLPAGVRASGRIDTTAVLVPDAPVRWTARATLDAATVPTGGAPSERIHVERVELAMEGEIDSSEPARGGPIRAQLRVPTVRGRIASVEIPNGIAPIAVTFDGRAAAGAAPAILGKLVLDNGLTGRLDAEVEAEDLASAPTLVARWRLGSTSLRQVTDLARRAGAAFPEGLALDGNVRAEGDSAWPASVGALLRARLRSDHLAVALQNDVRLDRASLAAAVTWPNVDALIGIQDLELTGDVEAPPVPKAALVVNGEATLDLQARAVRNVRSDITSQGLFAASATGGWSRASGGTFAVTLGAIDVRRWQAFLRPWIGDPAPGFSANGMVTAAITGEITRDLAWSGSGEAAITKNGFASEDGARVLEGLDTTWDVTVSGRGLTSGSARGAARVGGFQILWDSFFADFATLPSSMAVEGSFAASNDGHRAWNGKLAWRYPDGPALELAVSAGTVAATKLDAGLAVADLQKMLATYLRAPLGDTVPWFTNIAGGGALDVRARASIEPDAIELAGRVNIDDMRIEGTKGFVEVNGLDLNLPYDLRWGAGDAEGHRPLTGPPLSGALGFRTLDVGGMTVSETRTPLHIEADTVGLEEGVAIPLLGGVVGFEKLTLIDALRPTRRAETAIQLWDLQLNEAAAAFGLPPLEGAANGYFPAVTLQGSSFHVDGGGEVAVFGGKVKIGDIAGEDILTRFPKMRLNADFDGIDLQRVTGTFDFGEMTGFVRGYVHDLELFLGVPTRFDAKIETAPVKGVRNKVNVKAVNNIAILGTGGVGILDRGIHKFIDEFTYDRLGIELQLLDDAFLIRGLEHRGDRELFLKGRLPFPIDVVNAQPGRTVSFRSMLERLRALDFSQATTR